MMQCDNHRTHSEKHISTTTSTISWEKVESGGAHVEQRLNENHGGVVVRTTDIGSSTASLPGE